MKTNIGFAFRAKGRESRVMAAGLFVVLGATIFASDAAAQTLEEALVAAYRNNPTLQAARAELRAVDESVPQALSNWRPNISSSAETGKTFTKSAGGATGTVEGNRNPRTLNVVEVEQPLFRGFRTLAETREAENRVRAQRAILVNTEQDIMELAATAYMDVVRDQAVLDLNVNNVQVLERQLEATKDRFQVGEVTRTDVAQAEARLSRARADRVQAEGSLESSRARYENIVGEAPGKLDQPPPLKNIPDTLRTVVERAGDRSPDVIRAKFIERAARDNVDKVGGELLPSASLLGSVSRSRDVGFNGARNDSETVSAKISIPLYQSGAVTSRLRQAKQIVGQRRMEIIAARRAAVEEASRTWESLQTSRAQVQAFNDESKANTIALEGVREEAAAGLRTVLDVLDAEQELLDAQVNLVRAQRDEVVASVTVFSAMGQLTAESLGLSVDVYNPNQHYENVRLKFWGLGDALPTPTD